MVKVVELVWVYIISTDYVELKLFILNINPKLEDLFYTLQSFYPDPCDLILEPDTLMQKVRVYKLIQNLSNLTF